MATDPAFEFWPRVKAAIEAAAVDRFAVEFEWPTCHRKGCTRYHGDPIELFRIWQKAIADTVHAEMLCAAVTDPDEVDSLPG